MLFRVFAYTLIPVAAGVTGSIIAAMKPPGPRLKSTIQHFAAGLVFAAASIELLPGVMKQSPFVAITGFSLGILTMLILRWVTATSSRRSRRGDSLSSGLVMATGVDIFVDGVVTGAGFAASGKTGILLIIALSMELFFLGLSVASGIKGSLSRSLLIPSGLSLMIVAGAITGTSFLDGVSPPVLGTVLAFGAVALMYLVTEELLVEAHEAAETPLATAMFFVGFLIYLVIEELMSVTA